MGKVNLAAALVTSSRFDEGLKLLAQLQKSAKKESNKLLYAHLLEIKAQAHIMAKDWSMAYESLREARSIIKTGVYHLFLEKWYAVLKIYQNNANKESIQKLLIVKEKAVLLKHYETIRDCDYHLCMATKDDLLFQKLYFGSSSMAYKKRLENNFSNHQINETYIWSFGMGSKNEIFSIDTKSGENSNNNQSLKSGQLIQRLLETLSSDFYAPQKLGNLFEKLYPNEYFNPIHSPNRIHQSLFQLRKWLKISQIDINIIEQNSTYALSSDAKVRMTLYKESFPGNKDKFTPQELHRYLILEKHLKNKGPFSLMVASGLLHKCSDRTTSRLLKLCIEIGFIKKISGSSYTQYQF